MCIFFSGLNMKLTLNELQQKFNLLSPPNECPCRTKFVRRLWNGLRTCVCASVRAQNVKVCFFSVISWPILILFVLSDRAWCGLQNFYTEFWNSLLMQIYANLFKINEKCYFSVISWPILFKINEKCTSDLHFRRGRICVIYYPLVLFVLSKILGGNTANEK